MSSRYLKLREMVLLWYSSGNLGEPCVVLHDLRDKHHKVKCVCSSCTVCVLQSDRLSIHVYFVNVLQALFTRGRVAAGKLTHFATCYRPQQADERPVFLGRPVLVLFSRDPATYLSLGRGEAWS